MLVLSRAVSKKWTRVEGVRRPKKMVEGVRWALAIEEAERRRARERLERHAKERLGSPSPEQMVVECVAVDRVVQIQCEDCGVRYPEGTVYCPICNDLI